MLLLPISSYLSSNATMVHLVNHEVILILHDMVYYAIPTVLGNPSHLCLMCTIILNDSQVTQALQALQ
jgi:hypothetical protein